jgi:metal-responsive CopG/Arc/MetJ family transcriptional regulator
MSGTKIKIEKDLYDNLADAAAREGYASTDEFIHHVLERAVRGERTAETSDEQDIETQLRGLGYVE